MGIEWIAEIGPELVAFLLLAGFVAGFVDAIAGGGGLIALPAMMLAGVDPLTALATNKVQAIFGTATAVRRYARAGLVNPLRQWRAALMAFGGAILGALAVSALPVELLRMGLPLLLIVIALYFAFAPGLSDADGRERMSPLWFTLIAVPLIGFYDGLLGPGTGSFFMLAFVTLAGCGMLKATARTKFLNLASNIGSLLAFSFVVEIWWGLGLAMAVTQVMGAQLGAGMAMKRGARLIKPLLVITTMAMALRLLWDWI